MCDFYIWRWNVGLEQLTLINVCCVSKKYDYINLHLIDKGVVTTREDLSPAAQNRKKSDPGHLGHLFYILCGHFDEKKKNRGYPLRWRVARVSRQSSKVGGWLSPQNIVSRHFEKLLHGLVLRLSGHVRNTISLLYK